MQQIKIYIGDKTASRLMKDRLKDFTGFENIKSFTAVDSVTSKSMSDLTSKTNGILCQWCEKLNSENESISFEVRLNKGMFDKDKNCWLEFVCHYFKKQDPYAEFDMSEESKSEIKIFLKKFIEFCLNEKSQEAKQEIEKAAQEIDTYFSKEVMHAGLNYLTPKTRR